ncbi:hypothetical protein SLA2020_266590 [Shorea laevis]
MFPSLQICTLKVDITCCDECPIKLKKKLLKTNGVTSVDIDSKQGTVKVEGDIDPMILMQMFEKMGKPAELWSFEKVPSQFKASGCNNNKKQAPSTRDHDYDNEYEPKGVGATRIPMQGGGDFGRRGGFPPYSNSRYSGAFPNPLYYPGPTPLGYYGPPPSALPPRSTYGYGYGYYPSSRSNPMTHYTSYWDNYRLSP